MATTTTTIPASAPLGSVAATVQYSPVLFSRAMTTANFSKKLSGPIQADQYASDGRKESSSGYPIQEIYELNKRGSGDRVTFDIVDRVGGKPSMNDVTAATNKQGLEFARDEAVLGLSRKQINVGSTMVSQRAPHNLRNVAMSEMVRYFSDLEDNRVTVHLAGARGVQTGAGWKVPLDTDPDFANIMVNPVLPPTRNRYFCPGGNADVTTLDATDLMSLNFIDDLRTIADVSEVPLHGVDMPDFNLAGNSETPLYLGFMSSEQWNTLMKSTSEQNYRTFLAQATDRVDFRRHPLFRDAEMGMWRGIVWLKMPRAIEFAVGSPVKQYNATTGALGTVNAAVRTHRGFIVGGQALAKVFGDATPVAAQTYLSKGTGQTTMGVPYSWIEEGSDAGNQLDITGGLMNGLKKIRYTLPSTASAWDNGVIVFDTAQPAIPG